MKPALDVLERAGGELDFDELLNHMAALFGVDLTAGNKLNNGLDTALANDLKWALSYLSIEGKLQLSADGARVFGQRRHGVGLREAAAVFEAAPGLATDNPAEAEHGDMDAGSQDDADLANLFKKANRRLKRDLLGHVHAREPAFFEQLILDLLVAMGYAQARDWHTHAQRLGGHADGGVDGMIVQDELGLDFFCIQAKRYKPSTTVQIATVRDFAGSLEAHKAPKGVFVTTAYLPKSAHRFVAAIPRRITLIDGDGQANLMIRHNIGVKPEPLYTLKQIDRSYFNP